MDDPQQLANNNDIWQIYFNFHWYVYARSPQLNINWGISAMFN